MLEKFELELKRSPLSVLETDAPRPPTPTFMNDNLNMESVTALSKDKRKRLAIVLDADLSHLGKSSLPSNPGGNFQTPFHQGPEVPASGSENSVSQIPADATPKSFEESEDPKDR